MTTPSSTHQLDEKVDYDLKTDAHHLEAVDADVGVTVDAAPPLDSAFANLTSAQTVRKFWRLYLMGAGAAFAGVYIGYTVTIPGSIVANQGFIDAFGSYVNPATGRLELDAVHVSLWGGTNYAAQVIFQSLSPITADRYGIKCNMYILTGAMLIAIILEIVAKNWIVYLLAKIFSGISAAYIGTGVMTYMSEISMPKMRGALLGLFSFMFGFGQLIAAIGLQILQKTNPLAFRNAFYSEFAVLAIWLVPVVFLPESPVFLCKKGRHDKAKKALNFLVGNVEGYDLEHEYSVIRREVEASAAMLSTYGTSNWAALFKGKNLIRALMSGLPLTFQNMVGAPLVFSYSTYFFAQAGLKDAFQASLIIQIILLFGIVLSFFFVEKAGRRPLTLGGGLVCGIAVIIIGGLGHIPTGPAAGNALISVSCIWVFSYSLSLAPIGWIYTSEVATIALRAKSAAFSVVVQSFTGILFNYTVPIMLSEQKAGWGLNIGFFFGGITALYLPLVYFFMPETRGRTFTQLDELFLRDIPYRRFGQTKTYAQEIKDGVVPTTA